MGCQDLLVPDLRLISCDPIKVLIRVKLHVSLNIARRAKRSFNSDFRSINEHYIARYDENESVTYFSMESSTGSLVTVKWKHFTNDVG